MCPSSCSLHFIMFLCVRNFFIFIEKQTYRKEVVPDFIIRVYGIHIKPLIKIKIKVRI